MSPHVVTVTAMMTARAPERLSKVVLLGDTAVGKTTLLHRYIHDSFLPITYVTVGVACDYHSLEIEPGVHVNLQIWTQMDTRKMIQMYISNTDGFLLVFDVTNRESFENIKNEWFPFVPESSPCVLVGHKSENENRCVSREEAEELAKELGVSYVEASSVTGHNVKEREVKSREEQPKEEARASCLLM
uniref:Uncharacterized protein n=1 Tax=Neogobius melanostomus TaxID=47308 RepID=A0A8C6TUG5_9GOBI